MLTHCLIMTDTIRRFYKWLHSPYWTQHLVAMQARVKEHEALVKELKDLRANCEHDWDAPFPGHEHEGRLCKKCGINDFFCTAA